MTITDSSSVSITAAWLALPHPLHAEASRDGSLVAVTTTQVPPGSTDEHVQLVIVDVASGEARTLPAARPGDHTATWSPDGRRVAFITARTGVPQLAVADLEHDEPSAITSLPAGAMGPASWSPDGLHLVIACGRGRTVDRTAPWRMTRAVQWFDGIGALDDPPQLWVCTVADGTCRMVTDDDWWWTLPRWSHDGRSIAARASFDPDERVDGQHLRIIDLDGGCVTPDVPGAMSIVHDWAADGSLIVLCISPRDRPHGADAVVRRVHPDGRVSSIDTPVPVGGSVYGDSPALIGEVFESALVVQGTEVLLRTQFGGRMGIVHHSLDDGSWHEVVTGHRATTPIALTPHGLVMAAQSAGDACGLERLASRTAPTDRGASLSLLAACDPPSAAEVHRFTVRSPHDGALLEAWHLRPADTSAALPTVLLIHGGPAAAFGEFLNLDAQALCAAGFGVLYTNPHGSTGHGDDFTFSNVNHWGDIPSADVFAVIDEAVARGWVDDDRLGVAGLSYGGYLSSWLACTSDRFRAAVAENPVTNLLSMYGTSDISVPFLPPHFGGTPLDDVGPYLRWSPLMHAASCRTPILFVIGDHDRRCPPTQAFELHTMLRSLDRVSEVLVLPGCSHNGSTYGPVAARLAHDEALVQWMTQWLCAD